MYLKYKRWGRLHIDIPLLCGCILLMLIGLLVVFSAGSSNMVLLQKQLILLGLALAVMLVFSQIPPTFYLTWAPWLYITGLVLLFGVLFFGETHKGAQRWLNLGIVSFQPSEIMKLAVPMTVAWYFSNKKLPPTFLNILAVCAIIGVPMLLVVLQPDLDTAILFVVSGIVILFLAGISYKYILLIIGLAAASVPLIWQILHDYQRMRILTLFNPEQDPLGSGYHIIQSKIAIGSGGMYGKGWLNGTQSHLQFLPEVSTDFIFAVFGEEFGFIGAVVLLLIYLAVTARGLYIAYQAQDTFTRLLAGGLILAFAFYVIVNAGMVIGLFPVVGIPMPLLSYGGTSLITFAASFGILMSIHTHRKIL